MPRLWLIAPIYQKRGFVVIDGHPDIRYPVAEPLKRGQAWPDLSMDR